MSMLRFKVSTRLYLGFGLILLILAAVTMVAMWKVRVIDDALRANAELHAQIQRYAINFRGSAHDRAIAIRDVVLAGDAAERETEGRTIERLARFYAESAQPLEALLRRPDAAPELAGLYQGVQAIEAQAVATTQAIQAHMLKGERDAALSLLWQQAKPQYTQWLAAINKLIDFEEGAIQAKTLTAREQAGGFRAVMLTALVLALLAGGVLAWRISRSIVVQLGAEPAELGLAAQRVAAGDLSPVPGAEQAREGSVLASLGTMQQGLAQVVGTVRQASDSIATGSAEIANGNSDLSQRTEQQASHVQSTTQLMGRLAQTVQTNADTAAEANRQAEAVSTVAEASGQLVGQVVTTMAEISTSSKRIGDIIGVIDGIAFQTNILALNAAVEAARAGEAGRGFAVVASEVRSLAQRAAGAAREIKGLIGASVDKVEHGSRLVDEAGRTMEALVQQIQQVGSLIGEISSASRAQAQDIGEVGQSVDQIDHSTQQNAALVEQSAAAADSLCQQAAQLAETVRVFKL
ncbi:MAG: methyl-accepting chemotaxis protein [Inhella sp.]